MAGPPTQSARPNQPGPETHRRARLRIMFDRTSRRLAVVTLTVVATSLLPAGPALVAAEPQASARPAGTSDSALRAAIVQRALTADQYHAGITEQPLGSNCNAYTTFLRRGWPSTPCGNGLLAEEWCSDFAVSIWGLSGVPATSALTALAYSFISWGTFLHTLRPYGAYATPRLGDAVVWGDAGAGTAVHVGIVTTVTTTGSQRGWIKVTSGNAGKNADRVWTSALLNPLTSRAGNPPQPIIGFVSPDHL